jgi:hypothetical protein
MSNHDKRRKQESVEIAAVKVGQTWEYIGNAIYITPTRFTVVDISEDGIVCQQTPRFMMWKSPLSDFLANFEKV